MLYPIIVLEGADCSGKTTLAKRMVQKWDASYLHATYRWPDCMFTYHAAILERALKLAKKGPVIIDRWWPSELIYSDVFRNGSKWPLIGRQMDRLALKYGILYVNCIPSDTDWQERQFSERKGAGGELYDSNRAVAEQYREHAAAMAHRHDQMIYDVCKNGKQLDFFIDSVEERAGFVLNLQLKEWRDPDMRDWSGNSHKPKYLFVTGKQVPFGRHHMGPFFGHEYASFFLTNALQMSRIPEEDIAWFAAIDHEGKQWPQALAGIHDKLKPQKVLAFGKDSWSICKDVGLDLIGNLVEMKSPTYYMQWRRQTGFIEMCQALQKAVK